jgi:hypothetical protein
MTSLPDDPATRWFLLALGLFAVLAAPALALLPWSSPVTAALVSAAVVVAYVGGYHLAVGGGLALLRGRSPPGAGGLG